MEMNWSASRREQRPALDRNLFKRVPSGVADRGLAVDFLKFCGTTFLFVHKIDAQYPQQNVGFKQIVKPKVRFLRRSPPEQKHHKT
jgi:hypothetical protein